MDRMVEDFVVDCKECGESDKAMKTVSQPLCPLEVPEGPWKRVGIDILGPYSNLEKYQVYFIVMIDHFSKWPEIKMVRKVTSKDVVEFLKEVIRREGFPKEMLSDNGPQFTSEEVAEFCKHNGIKWKFGSVYHPETNGQVERLNRVITECIQLSLASELGWKSTLNEMIYNYRLTPHVSTGYSPFKLMRGRDPITKLRPDWIMELCKEEKVDLSVVKGRLICSKEKMKKEYDARKHRKFVEVYIGDEVKVKKEGVVRKGDSKYSKRKNVVKVFEHSVRLSDGKIWNKNRIVKCKNANNKGKEVELKCGINLDFECEEGSEMVQRNKDGLDVGEGLEVEGECEDVLEKENEQCEVPQSIRCSARGKKLPEKFKEFILYK